MGSGSTNNEENMLNKREEKIGEGEEGNSENPREKKEKNKSKSH